MTHTFANTIPIANGAENFISTYGAHNAYVINSPITRQLIRDFSVSVEVFDFIFIPDLTQWMEDLLPHEMEEVKGGERGIKEENGLRERGFSWTHLFLPFPLSNIRFFVSFSCLEEKFG